MGRATGGVGAGKGERKGSARGPHLSSAVEEAWSHHPRSTIGSLYAKRICFQVRQWAQAGPHLVVDDILGRQVAGDDAVDGGEQRVLGLPAAQAQDLLHLVARQHALRA
jgi:hypothetical protein